MKVLLLISMITMLATATTASGQNVSFKPGEICTNRNVEVISSREIIKIGAKIDDVLNLFASTEEEKRKIRSNSSGRKRTNIGYEVFVAAPKPNDARFEGISYYIFNFLDGNLMSFTVSYTKPRWRDAKQFAERMSEIFNLPEAEFWENQVTRAMLQCENYQIRVDVENDIETAKSFFGVYDNRIEEILKQRQQKFEDEQRDKDLKTFKP